MPISRTPYRFTPDVIRKEVMKDVPGSYLLGNDQGERDFAPRYVGRSDNDMQGRLLTHNHLYSYEYFIFRKASDPKEAFRQECQLWHGHQQCGYELDNKVHPAVPVGLDVRCPYCDFANHMSALQVN